jgi:hypothetical protein
MNKKKRKEKGGLTEKEQKKQGGLTEKEQKQWRKKGKNTKILFFSFYVIFFSHGKEKIN